MKKFILFFIALLLSACASTPQVTVTSEVTVTLTLPSETPTSAPTATATPEPYMQSAPQFVSEINFEGDWKVAFDEEGNTVIIDVTSGDELGEYQEGDWIPNPEQVWKQEAKDWKIDLNNVTKKYDVEGNIVIIDNTNKEIIYWQGSWSLTKARDLIINFGNCKKTEWVGVKDRSMASTNETDRFKKVFFFPMIERVQAELRKLREPGVFFAYDFLGGEGNCWATEPVDSVGMRADHMDKTRIFWIDADGQLRNKTVFSIDKNEILLEEIN